MAERVSVADYMATKLITLPVNMEITQAMHVLLDNKISGAPVVDASGKLVGVLSRKDCLRACLHASYHQQMGHYVYDYMSREVDTLPADLDIVGACERFINSNYRRFPVLREGRLVGQISRVDVLQALVDHWQ